MVTLTVLLAMTALVAGCKGGGGPTASFTPSGGTSFIAAVTTTPTDSATTPDTGGEENPVVIAHQPEPTSVLLLGLGLAGAVLLRRRMK